MTSYFIRRLILVPITFLVITFLVYSILRVVPGGPIEQAEASLRMQAMQGEAGGGSSAGGDDADLQLDAEGLKELEEYYALDQPVVVGYMQWLGVWPRDVKARVPVVPLKGNKETLDALRQAAEGRDKAGAALAEALAPLGLIEHEGRLYEPMVAEPAGDEPGTPEAVLPEEKRAEAARLRERTFGTRLPLQRLLAADNVVYVESSGYAKLAETPAEVAPLLEAQQTATKAAEAVEAASGYTLNADGGLTQSAFGPLLRLQALRAEARGRLDAHLGKKNLIEFQSSFYEPVAKGDREPAKVFEKADDLVAGGFGKRDDLLALLAEHGLTWQGGKYFREVTSEQREKDSEFFGTAAAHLAAAHLAGTKLKELQEEHGFQVREGGRVYQVESRFSGILQGDFGRSYTRGEPVLKAIVSRFDISIPLGLTGFLLTWLVCIPLGVMKAVRHRSAFDTVTSFIVFLGYSMPGFVVCVLLLASVAVWIDFFPLGGYDPDASLYDRFRHMLIPVAGYMVGSFATLTILTKNSLMDNLTRDYVRTAVAKGLPERRVVYLHALRNSLIPVTARLGHALGILFAGSFLIEKACNIDGMGLLGYHAIVQRDFPIILGTLVFGVLIKLFGNILSDIIWAAIDPRIRFS
ncbi:MAG: ABC transporter permease subunit [Planctomycetota bacterium]|jgi:microcin C transport system permease protein